MTDLPAPMTASDCDLSGFTWNTIFCDQLFEGPWREHSLKDPLGANATLFLWWQAMKEVPAGSLRDDEAWLCDKAGFGRDVKTFRKHRSVIMDGYVLCSDGRWHHPWLAEIATDAYSRKLQREEGRSWETERKRRYRAKMNGHAERPEDRPENPTQRNDVPWDIPRDIASCPTGHPPGTVGGTTADVPWDVPRARLDSKKKDKERAPLNPPTDKPRGDLPRQKARNRWKRAGAVELWEETKARLRDDPAAEAAIVVPLDRTKTNGS